MEPRDESEGVDPDQTLADACFKASRAHTWQKMSLIVKIDTIDKNM